MHTQIYARLVCFCPTVSIMVFLVSIILFAMILDMKNESEKLSERGIENKEQKEGKLTKSIKNDI